MEDDDMDMPQTVPAEPTTGSFPPDTELAPATAVSEPSAVSDIQSEDEARRAHEAAEAKRKAEWDARQAEKQRAEQAALEKLDAMSPAELLKAAAKRVSAGYGEADAAQYEERRFRVYPRLSALMTSILHGLPCTRARA